MRNGKIYSVINAAKNAFFPLWKNTAKSNTYLRIQKLTFSNLALIRDEYRRELLKIVLPNTKFDKLYGLAKISINKRKVRVTGVEISRSPGLDDFFRFLLIMSFCQSCTLESSSFVCRSFCDMNLNQANP